MVHRAEKFGVLSRYQALGRDHDRLLFNFLRISPSYALICQSGGQKITRATPHSTRLIIQTFRKYGDVYRIPYEDWSGPIHAMSGKTTLKEQTLLIRPKEAIECPDGYEGIFIPSHLDKKRKLSLVKRLIDSLPSTPTKDAETIRPKTLWKALAAVYEKAKHPDTELWRIGLLANLVERFAGRLDPWCKRKLAKDAEMRRHLTLMTIRALFIGLVVAENAAQGYFPVRTPVMGEQMEFAFAEQRLYNLLTAHGEGEHQLVLDHAFGQSK